MIRQVELQDAKAITNIYNEYVLHSVATFDTEPVQEEEMRARIAEISSRFPYFVYEEDKEIHRLLLCPYVERAFSLPLYAGNNCLPVSRTYRKGHRDAPDAKID